MAVTHARSTSLPDDSHPVVNHIKDLLSNLKVSESFPLCDKLAGLKDLHDCLNDFLQLPEIQQAIVREIQNKDLLDGSLRLLDTCSVTSDAYSVLKDSVQALESSIRRSHAGDSGLTSEVEGYIASRKRLNKMSHDHMRKLKKNDKSVRTESHEMVVVNILKEAEEISLELFESILLFVSQVKSKPKPSGLSIVSKLLHSKPVASAGKPEDNKFEKIDMELLLLKSSKEASPVQLHNILKDLSSVELSIREMGIQLEFIYRSLVKSRVTLLNISLVSIV